MRVVTVLVSVLALYGGSTVVAGAAPFGSSGSLGSSEDPGGNPGEPEPPEELDRIVPKPETVEVGSESVQLLEQSNDGRQRVLIASPQAVPETNGFLVAPASDAAPDGILSRVDERIRNDDGTWTLTVVPATIDEAYSEFELDVTRALDEAIIEPPEEGSAPNARALPIPGLGLKVATNAFECKNGSGVELGIQINTADIGIRMQLSMRNQTMLLGYTFSPELSASLAAAGKVTCSVKDRFLPKVKVPLLATPPLVGELKPAAEVSIGGAFETSVAWKPQVSAGVVYEKGSIRGYGSITQDFDHDPGTLFASSSAFMGMSIGAKLAGRVGLAGQVGPELGFKFDHQGCRTIEGSVAVKAKVEVDALFTNWSAELAKGSFGSRTLNTSCTGAVAATADNVHATRSVSNTRPSVGDDVTVTVTVAVREGLKRYINQVSDWHSSCAVLVESSHSDVQQMGGASVISNTSGGFPPGWSVGPGITPVLSRQFVFRYRIGEGCNPGESLESKTQVAVWAFAQGIDLEGPEIKVNG